MLFGLLLLILTLISQAQVKITSITRRESKSSWLSYSFPLIRHSNPTVAKKINSYLQKEILDNPKIETSANKIFEHSRYINNDSVHQSGLSEISFSVEVNNPRMLSLSFQIEGTGAYSETYPLYYNFDLSTGGLIETKKLLTAAGMVHVQKLLVEKRKRRIDEAIRENTPSISDSASVEDSSWISERYSECNKEPGAENILIKKNSILFYKGYCFPHVARPFDTNLDIDLSFIDLRKYFTNYANALLTPKKSAKK